MLGISQSYISRLEKKIISKLKKDLSSSIWINFYLLENIKICHMAN
jgi:hypothetical protein